MRIHFPQQAFGNENCISFVDLANAKVVAEVWKMSGLPGTQELQVHLDGSVVGVGEEENLVSASITTLNLHLRSLPLLRPTM